jgi:hypothetical protein
MTTLRIVASDSFTRANGALGTTDGAGGGGANLPWTGATWTISGNTATNTPTVGVTELFANSDFSAWTGDNPNSWTVSGESAPTREVTERSSAQTHASAPAGTGAVNLYTSSGYIYCYQLLCTTGLWYQYSFPITAYASGLAFVLANGATRNLFSSTASGAYRSTVTSNAMGVLGDTSGCDMTLDNVSLRQIVLPSMFATVETWAADVEVEVRVTASAWCSAGLVLNLDSTTSPANFVTCYLDANRKLNLVKCVAGVYTELISTAITYVAGAILKVIKTGASYSAYYNGAQVGTTPNDL